METQLLREAGIYPTMEVLREKLGKIYPLFEELMSTVTSEKYHLELKWHYYNDGKAWLCRALKKSRTVFWLSVWNKCYKTSFFFTTKTVLGIEDLKVTTKIKEVLKDNKPIGKLVPLIIRVDKKKQIKDVLVIMEYKISLK